MAAIDAGLVIQVLDPIWSAKPETASRVRGRIEAVLDAATVRGYREGPNTAEWEGNLAHILPERGKVRKVEHHTALPYGEIPAFLVDLRQREATAALALEFAIMTATRTGETLGARWGEINLDDRVWTIPADRMKAGREHRVPLNDLALAVIEKARPLGRFADRISDHAMPVFPGPRPAVPLSNMAYLMLLRRMGRGNITAHGFRSTFSDWAAERTAFPREVVEMALAHAIESKVKAAYRRGDLFDKQLQLMDAWARFCEAPVTGEVVPLWAVASGVKVAPDARQSAPGPRLPDIAEAPTMAARNAEEWFSVGKAVEFVRECRDEDVVSRGAAAEILCLAGFDGTVRTRGADSIRDWAEIDPDKEVVRDGHALFGIWQADVLFSSDDLHHWLRRNRDWLLSEYAAMPSATSLVANVPKPIPKGKPGRKPSKRKEIANRTLSHLTSGKRTPKELKGGALEALKTAYGGSPNTANAARKQALAQFSEIPRSDSEQAQIDPEH